MCSQLVEPQPGCSWVTSGGLILDTAALLFAVVDGPQPRQAQITFKAGCLALNRVYRFFDIKASAAPVDSLPESEKSDPGRLEFDQACQLLADKGLKICEDRNAAWQRYGELRSRYAKAVQFLSRLLMAPS